MIDTIVTDPSEPGWIPVFFRVMLVVYVITFLQFAVKYFVFWKKVKK